MVLHMIFKNSFQFQIPKIFDFFENQQIILHGVCKKLSKVDILSLIIDQLEKPISMS